MTEASDSFDITTRGAAARVFITIFHSAQPPRQRCPHGSGSGAMSPRLHHLLSPMIIRRQRLAARL